MKFPHLPLRSQQPWLEGTFWVVVTGFIIVAIAWQFASGPPVSFSTDQTPLPSIPQTLRISLPEVPRPAPPPPGSARILETGADGFVEIGELVQLSKQLNAPDAAAGDDIEILHTLLDAFHRSQAWTGIPAAENEEFIAPLAGKNPRHLVFLPPDHPALNDRGQLLDRWGTPYSFHPDAAAIPEIRSAGPDRTLFTGDDVVGR